MEARTLNRVKIYDLTSGTPLPDWISDKQRKLLLRRNIKLRRRIELMQDFSMPDIATNIMTTPDAQYILATGTYRPQLRCFEVRNLSMKFDICFDYEVAKMLILSEDYSKPVFLHHNRYVEFHTPFGKHYSFRIPNESRDFSYLKSTCDLYFVGSGYEINRFNLELGRFLKPLSTNACNINTCTFNPVHELFLCGSDEGRVEAWDPRSKSRAGVLDCAFSSVSEHKEVTRVPAVTSLCCKDSLTLAVGTSTGQVLLYDIRSSKPAYVKDHMNDLPIRKIEFCALNDTIFSMDSKILKIWERTTGKPYTYIEPLCRLNDFCMFPNSGLVMFATENPKMLAYYIPSIGPAPKWCSFIDSVVEELEENEVDSVYEDYKFVTPQELESLGLSHLVGSQLLRAYMHGYFINSTLYRKAYSYALPNAFAEHRKNKIKEKLKESSASRVKMNVPKVNKNLAEQLKLEQQQSNSRSKTANMLLGDNRFKAIFDNPDFEIDETAKEYASIKPLVAQAKMLKQKKLEKEEKILEELKKKAEDQGEVQSSSEDEVNYQSDSEEEKVQNYELMNPVKPERNPVRRKASRVTVTERQSNVLPKLKSRRAPQFYELKPGEEFRNLQRILPKDVRSKSFEERVKEMPVISRQGPVSRSVEMSFVMDDPPEVVKENKQLEKANEAVREHIMERRKVARKAGRFFAKRKPRFMRR